MSMYPPPPQIRQPRQSKAYAGVQIPELRSLLALVQSEDEGLLTGVQRTQNSYITVAVRIKKRQNQFPRVP